MAIIKTWIQFLPTIPDAGIMVKKYMKNIVKNDIELLMKSYLFDFDGKYNI